MSWKRVEFSLNADQREIIKALRKDTSEKYFILGQIQPGTFVAQFFKLDEATGREVSDVIVRRTPAEDATENQLDVEVASTPPE